MIDRVRTFFYYFHIIRKRKERKTERKEKSARDNEFIEMTRFLFVISLTLPIFPKCISNANDYLMKIRFGNFDFCNE